MVPVVKYESEHLVGTTAETIGALVGVASPALVQASETRRTGQRRRTVKSVRWLMAAALA